MKIKMLCSLTLLMGASFVVAQQNVPASNPLCGGLSGTAFVNWPQFHSDLCHTGYNPNEFLLSRSTVGNLVLDCLCQRKCVAIRFEFLQVGDRTAP